jgi:hypothetical protein
MEGLTHFARQRLGEETLWAVRHCFIALNGKLAERGRDLGFCRQRLRHLQESIESGPTDPEEETRLHTDHTLGQSPLPSTESFWEAIRQSSTARVVLPDNEEDLERAAVRFLQRLTPEQWTALDKDLNERVLLPRGGLHGSCMNSGDLTRMLTNPLMEEAGHILGEHLPIMDVAQILAAEFGIACDGQTETAPLHPELEGQARNYVERAVPLISAKKPDGHQGFLLVPASPAGRTLGEAVRTVLPDLKLVRVPGQSDLMFCREQGLLSIEDLKQFLRPCRAAYEALVGAPPTSPHARFDILDWVPLDP